MLKRLVTAVCLCLSTLSFAATDANKASEIELTAVKGIGPATAARIVQAREQGPFKNWEDLIARVNGIAATSAQNFSDAGLTIDGHPRPKTPAPAPAPAAETKPSEKTGKSASPS